MATNNKITGFKLEPGVKLSEEMLGKLAAINETYSKTRNTAQYARDIAQLFNLTPKPVTEESKRFLGGFIEGEASLNVGAKKLKTAQFGVLLDPEFSLTQHVNGVIHLHQALIIFQTGRIRHKSGSNATLVFTIHDRVSLEEKVVPFYNNYVVPYACPVKVQRLHLFRKMLQFFKEGLHRDLKSFLTQLLPLWDSMRMQKGQSNESFKDLPAAQEYVIQFHRLKQTQ